MPQAAGAAKRTVRVRNRLVAGVAVVGIAVIAAGAPAALGASSDLNESQRLVTLAELNQQADRPRALPRGRARRGRPPISRAAVRTRTPRSGTTSPAARVDQQVDEIREAAPASLRRDLAAIPSLRRTALTGKGSAMEAYQAYSEVIDKLHGVADELARKTPPRAADATRAPLALGGAVEQASATRGLLLAALAVPGTKPQQQIDPFTGLPVQTQDEGGSENDRDRDELSAAAQQARVREHAALADFDQAAGPSARDRLRLHGHRPRGHHRREVPHPAHRPARAVRRRPGGRRQEGRGGALRPDRPHARRRVRAGHRSRSSGWRSCATTTSPRWSSASALLGALPAARRRRLHRRRPLPDPAARRPADRGRAHRRRARPPKPVRFTGRNDEFAEVVRSVNALHGRLHGLHHDVTGRLEGAAERAAAAAHRRPRGPHAPARRTPGHGGANSPAARTAAEPVHHTFVNLSLRTLGLVERQLGVIEGLEEREQDPERLATLFKLDHLATGMRRHSENLLVLAGADHDHGATRARPAARRAARRRQRDRALRAGHHPVAAAARPGRRASPPTT